jgi:carbamoyl-phosphate synthase small subunit
MDGAANAVLALEDGTVFRGKGFGARSDVAGEVVFNTSMIGYPELLTDPSYHEQIVVMTYPILGSYGIPSYSICDPYGVPLHFESDSVKVKGFVVHSLSSPSHWSSERSLHEWLLDENAPGISGLDTRVLTQKIRVNGTMLGFIAVTDEVLDDQTIHSKLARLKDPNKRNLVEEVSVKEPVHYVNESPTVVVVIDCGVKFGIIRNLLQGGVTVVRVPFDYPIRDILDLDPAGIVLSNGPGDPKKCTETIETTRELLDKTIPVMGICLGAQILALAAGGETYKLKFGHRAVNHPCLDLTNGRCYITTQNHGYTVNRESLEKTGFQTRFVNLNDKTVEGFKHRSRNIQGIQWHPESSPGPYDTSFLFDQFVADVLKQ